MTPLACHSSAEFSQETPNLHRVLIRDTADTSAEMRASLSTPTLKAKSNLSKERNLHGLGGWGRNLNGPSRWSLVGPEVYTANPSRSLLAKLLAEVGVMRALYNMR